MVAPKKLAHTHGSKCVDDDEKGSSIFIKYISPTIPGVLCGSIPWSQGFAGSFQTQVLVPATYHSLSLSLSLPLSNPSLSLCNLTYKNLHFTGLRTYVSTPYIYIYVSKHVHSPHTIISVCMCIQNEYLQHVYFYHATYCDENRRNVYVYIYCIICAREVSAIKSVREPCATDDGTDYRS